MKKLTVDLVGNIGEEGGIGNYSTKLYYALKDNENLEIRKKEYRLKSPFSQPILQNFFESPLKLFQTNADIIHFTDQEQAAGIFFIPEKYLQNTVVTVHDISPYVNSYSGPVTSVLSKLYVMALKKVGKIIAISEFTKSELTEHLDISEEKIEVIYQGIDQDQFSPREENKEILKKYGIEKPYVIYVGSEINRKNIRGNLEEYKELRKKNPDLKLVKVGDSGRKKYREKTLQHIEDMGLEEGEDIIFTGFVTEEELPYIYSMAEANLLFSHYEGFGRTALEAEACGTPTLTYKKPPMNEYLPEDRFKLHLNQKGSPKIQGWEESVMQTLKIYEKLK